MAALLWISLLCLVFGYLLRRHKTRKHDLLPSPSRLPIIGNLHQLGPQPQRSLQVLSQKHGPLLLLYFGSMPVLVASDNDSAEAVLKTHDRVFANRPSLIIPEHIFYKGKDLVFAKYGEYWRQVKKICIIHLFSAKQVESFRSVREEEVFIMVENIFKCSGPVNLSRVFRSTTNNIVSRVALGKKYYEENQSGGQEFMQLLEELMVLMGAFHIGDIFPSLAWIGKLTGLDARLKRNSKGWNDFLEQVIEDHVTRRRAADHEDNGRDFVDVLLEIRKSGELGFPVEQDHIKALVLDMFVAGTDTTYTVMEWTMAELIGRPTILKKAQKEVRTRGKSKIREEDLVSMPYLKSVIKETLRLHPPVPLLVPREATEDVKIGEYLVPAKTKVMVNVWAIGRDPKLWENAEEFNPERFMNAGSIDVKKHYFRLMPFGAGRRSCPGGLFALTIVELAIANLLNSFDWEFQGGERTGELDMAETCGITLRKKSPLLALARPLRGEVFKISVDDTHLW